MSRPKYKQWSRRVERNILACYHRADSFDRDAGLFWYSNARNEAQLIAERYGASVETVTGVICALSPGNEWGRNLVDAEALISAWVQGDRGKYLPIVGVYGAKNQRKAIDILRGKKPLDVLGGLKVRSFYSNMLDVASTEVTVDRHAKCGALNSKKDPLVRPKEYVWLAWHYRVIAKRLGLAPYQLQAICWVTWKRLNGRLEQEDLPF